VWVLSMRCSPSGTDCSCVGPPQVNKSCQQTCSIMESYLHGSTSPARSLLHHEVSMGSQSPLGIFTSSDVESTTGCRWTSSPPWTSMGCRRIACLTTAFSTGCKGIPAPAPEAPPPPPSSLTLVPPKFFSHFHSFPAAIIQIFFFFSPS